MKRKPYDFERKHIGEQAREVLATNNIILQKQYPLKKKIVLKARDNRGVDALKYLGPARRYIEKKYNISGTELEICLFLYPYNYFTFLDYGKISNGYFYRSLKILMKADLVRYMYKREDLKKGAYNKFKPKDVFTLTTKAKMAVLMFYRILSGETKPKDFKNKSYSDNDERSNAIKKLLQEMVDMEH